MSSPNNDLRASQCQGADFTVVFQMGPFQLLKCFLSLDLSVICKDSYLEDFQEETLKQGMLCAYTIRYPQPVAEV